MIEVGRANTILYAADWPAMVAFYRDQLQLPVEFENDWFVEFGLAPNAYLSVADAGRASIDAGTGAGITLTWQVPNVVEARRQLVAAGVDVSEVKSRWGASVAYLFDPAGNRIELWS